MENGDFGLHDNKWTQQRPCLFFEAAGFELSWFLMLVDHPLGEGLVLSSPLAERPRSSLCPKPGCWEERERKEKTCGISWAEMRSQKWVKHPQRCHMDADRGVFRVETRHEFQQLQPLFLLEYFKSFQSSFKCSSMIHERVHLCPQPGLILRECRDGRGWFKEAMVNPVSLLPCPGSFLHPSGSGTPSVPSRAALSPRPAALAAPSALVLTPRSSRGITGTD